jgi:hypothetical protein
LETNEVHNFMPGEIPVKIVIVAVMIGLLSIAAGAAKIALVPDEVEFLSQFGFTTILIVSFGTVQVLGGVLLVIPATRFYGSLAAALAFTLSAALLLIAGDLGFGGVSLVPVVLASLIAYQSCATGRAGQNSAAQ